MTTAANKQTCLMFGGNTNCSAADEDSGLTLGTLNRLTPSGSKGSRRLTVGPNKRMGVRVSVSAQLNSTFKCESALSVNLGFFFHKDINLVILKFPLVNFLVFAAFLSSSMFFFLPHH